MLEQKIDDKRKVDLSRYMPTAADYRQALFAAAGRRTAFTALVSRAASAAIAGVLILGLSSPGYAGSGNPACEKANAPSSCDQPAGASKKKIKYTIWNDSHRKVKFRLPSGKVYTLKPGYKNEYWNWASSNLQMTVLSSERTYTLSSGDHKFFWNKKYGRIGFDKDYRYD